ncbi:PIN domain-containing protein [Cohnella panacarvi]|uniref:PIN domain-containing protein n=1 Tax=Cohnella panacarvi TaxID=400776 RepID=UPI0004793107|nr:PIN domain-containing protein [Cohnella panacarvi]
MKTPDINLFLDTTLLFSDPFFKKTYNRQLLKFADVYGTPLILSKVVFEEARNKFLLNVQKRMGDLEKSLQALKDYYPDDLSTEKLQVSSADFENQFDTFFNKLIDRKLIQVVDYDNALLPELVRRSINRIKPFTDNKQEFRDAITWLTYTKKAKDENHEYCYFITHNKNDFLDSNGDLHPHLREDSDKFKVYSSSRELFDKDIILKPLITTVELVQWLEDNPITQKQLYALLELNFDTIYEDASDYVIREGNDVVSEDDAYCQPYGLSIQHIKYFKVDIINDEIIITGQFNVSVDVEVYIYNGFRDRDDDHYIHTGSSEVILDIQFSTSYDKDTEEIHLLQIERIQLIQPANVDYFDDYYEE